jgi:hypothetical protein
MKITLNPVGAKKLIYRRYGMQIVLVPTQIHVDMYAVRIHVCMR